jgi:hypothetical protein
VDVAGGNQRVEPMDPEQWKMFCGIAAIRLFLLGWNQNRTAHHRTLTRRKIDINTNVPNEQLDREMWNQIQANLDLLRAPVIPPVIPPPPSSTLPKFSELPPVDQYNFMEVPMESFEVYRDVPFVATTRGAVTNPGALGRGGFVVSVTPRTSYAGPDPRSAAGYMQFWENNNTASGYLIALLPNHFDAMNCDVVVCRTP